MGYSEATDRTLVQEPNIVNLQAQVKTASEKADAVHTRLEKQEEDLKNAQKEYIAILGIFSSVVLTFTAGIAFSTSVLQNLHTASIYRIVCVTLLIGIVLINVLYGLFYYIDRLINKPDDRKIKPLLITNIILILSLIGVGVCWLTGVTERRNLQIENTLFNPTAETQDIKTQTFPSNSIDIESSASPNDNVS